MSSRDILRLTGAFFITLTPVIAGCDSGVVDSDDTGIPVPTAYTFESRFQAGKSSIDYAGQVVRNIQIQDLKTVLDNLGKEGASAVHEADLLRYYEYDDAYDLTTHTSAGSMTLYETKYSKIATEKSLAGKISAATLVGSTQSADAYVRWALAQIAAASQDPLRLGTPSVYTSAEGVDLAQMVNKILLGAVPYSQATGTYLAGVLEQNNNEPREGQAYTAMEHAWDEAFGYFGAARDYGRYADSELAGTAFFKDSNVDGRIDLASEYNFAFARNAAKRDAEAGNSGFRRAVFDAFLEGRTAIVNRGSAQEIAGYREAAVASWEKVIAATVIFYLNTSLRNLEEISSDEVQTRSNANLNKHWAEMKGYAYALQFNPLKRISDVQLEQLHSLVGDAPPYTLAGSAARSEAVDRFTQARSILQSAYGFPDQLIAAW